MKTNIKHVFFDLDHTLWDFDKNSGLTFEKIFKIHNVNVNLNDFLKIYEPINLQYWKMYREEKITKKELRYSRLKAAFDALGMTVSDELINNLSRDYITYLSSFSHVFDGTFEILDYLKDKYVLHIITNGFQEVQSYKMKSSKLDVYFKTITDAETAGFKKPNAIIFDYAFKLANAKPEESIMIGDSFEADVEGAAAVGMDVVHFDYENSKPQETYKRITHLSELKALL